MRNTSLIFILVFLLGLYATVYAKVTGQCDNCHTMHNRQGNQPMNLDNTDKPNPALLITDCIGCHTGLNTGSNATPYVFDTGLPLYKTTGTEADSNTLAGGNFYWVKNESDRKGHNVYGITGPDPDLSYPPGGDSSFTSQLRCAGSIGCHGKQGVSGQLSAMQGAHHNKDHSIWQDGTSIAKSYRFLDNIQGLEDVKYEYHPTDLQHNKYYGVNRTQSTPVVGTISYLCARCHQDFHNGSGSIVPASSFIDGVWIRHPTDYDLSDAISSSEYENYNGGTGTGNTYSVISPLATTDKTTSLNKTVFSKSNDAIVMCISCHRAHGSPNNALLRWNYKAWPGPTGYNGCAICHTSKD